MNKFSAQDIEYYRELGEEEICVTKNMIVDRYVLPIEDGVFLYAFPDYVYNIRRITYLGRKLEPYSGQENIWSNSTPGFYPTGEPRQYIYNYYGKKQIRLYPTPSETLVADLSPWTGTGIMNQCVMSFYRTPDLNNEFMRLPEEIREQFIESYVIKEIAKMDAENFDTKTIKAFQAVFEEDMRDIDYIFGQCFKAVQSTNEPFGLWPGRMQKGRAQLPWQFGTVVE